MSLRLVNYPFVPFLPILSESEQLHSEVSANLLCQARLPSYQSLKESLPSCEYILIMQLIRRYAHMFATTVFRLATKFAFISLFTVNLYDHLLTFPDEVKYIWQRKFTPGILILLSSSLFHVLNTEILSYHRILHRTSSILSSLSMIKYRNISESIHSLRDILCRDCR